MPSFWRQERRQWINFVGGSHKRHKDDVVHLTVRIADSDLRDELSLVKAMTDHQRDVLRRLAKERLCKPTNTSGWIAPSGEWFPCGWRNHDNFCTYFFQVPIFDLERTHARVDHEFWQIQGGIVTAAMKERLIRMGFVDADGELYHMREEVENEVAD